MKFLSIPVAIFAYQRVLSLEQTINSLKSFPPKRLYFFLDYPSNVNEETLATRARINSLAEALRAWIPEVFIFANSKNLGLLRQIESGLTKVLSLEEKILVLEDDVIISNGAFEFIESEAARIDGHSIAALSLNNFLFGSESNFGAAIAQRNMPYLSNFFHCWGWVVSKRGWQLYRSTVEEELDEQFWSDLLVKFGGCKEPVDKWRQEVVPLLKAGMQSWACRFQLSAWAANAKFIVPPVNLATNSGWDSHAVHTKTPPTWLEKWHLDTYRRNHTATELNLSLDADLVEYENLNSRRTWLECRLCGEKSFPLFDAEIFEFPRRYYRCISCESLQTEPPSWLDQSYSSTISNFDTGIMLRNYDAFLRVKVIVDHLSSIGKLSLVLDVGAGAGILVRMLRDTGVNAYAYDRYGATELASPFRLKRLEDSKSHSHDILIITAFEVLEHFSEPKLELHNIFDLKPDFIVTSTELYTKQGPSWNYLQPNSGQHIFFYSLRALQNISERYGYQILAHENVQIFSRLDRPGICESTVREALQIKLSTQDGYRKFTTYLANASGVMSDYKQLTDSAERKRSRNEERKLKVVCKSRKKIMLDCIFFSMADTGITKLWTEVLRIWAKHYRDRLILIDRGGSIPDFGIDRIKQPAFDKDRFDAESVNISALCNSVGNPHFISTYYTYPKDYPYLAIVYDMIPEVQGEASSVWTRKSLYLKFCKRAHAISKTTASLLQQYYPNTEVVSEYPGVAECFINLSPADDSLRNTEVPPKSRRHRLILPCGLGSYKNGLMALKACEISEIAHDLEVIVTGPSLPEAELQRYFRRIKVVVRRFENDKLYAAVLRSSDLLLWPSLLEGVGFPPVEAILSGVSFIAVKNEINLEIHGDGPHLVEPTEMHFARMIPQMLNLPVSKERREYYLNRYNYANYSESLFNSITNNDCD